MLALFSAALAGHEHGSVLHILRACIRLTEEHAIPPGDFAALSRLPHVQQQWDHEGCPALLRATAALSASEGEAANAATTPLPPPLHSPSPPSTAHNAAARNLSTSLLVLPPQQTASWLDGPRHSYVDPWREWARSWSPQPQGPDGPAAQGQKAPSEEAPAEAATEAAASTHEWQAANLSGARDLQFATVRLDDSAAQQQAADAAAEAAAEEARNARAEAQQAASSQQAAANAHDATQQQAQAQQAERQGVPPASAEARAAQAAEEERERAQQEEALPPQQMQQIQRSQRQEQQARSQRQAEQQQTADEGYGLVSNLALFQTLRARPQLPQAAAVAGGAVDDDEEDEIGHGGREVLTKVSHDDDDDDDEDVVHGDETLVGLSATIKRAAGAAGAAAARGPKGMAPGRPIRPGTRLPVVDDVPASDKRPPPSWLGPPRQPSITVVRRGDHRRGNAPLDNEA